MLTQINLGDIAVDVVQKGIKNIHLSVHPPTGKVRIAAPLHMDVDTIRVFAISKLGWIKKQQEKLRHQEREAPREYLDRESHYYRGKRYLLKVVEEEAAPRVQLRHATMVLYVRPGADDEKKQFVIDEWYRRQLKDEIQPLIAKWQRHMGVRGERFSVRKMKTMWGSCSPKS
jgi:predicted metal-dependent hydrolase